MEKKTEKITLREVWSVHARVIRIIHKACPGICPFTALDAIVRAVTPYVTIFFSAHIIDELAGLRRPEQLWHWVLWTVASTGVLGVLKIWIGCRLKQEQNSFAMREKYLYTEKMFSMDFVDVDDQATHDKLSQIRQNENWAGLGLCKIIYDLLPGLLTACLSILSAAVLTVSLFTLPVPETAGRLTVLNSPLCVFALLGVGITISFLSGRLGGKVSALWVSAAEDATLGNRIFSHYGFLGGETEKAADIRMYEQEKLALYYMRENQSITPGGKMSRLAAGAAGIYSGLSAGMLSVFTGLAYAFTSLKAWGGAFGIGSVTQYVSAVTTLAFNVSNVFCLLDKAKSNTEFLRQSLAFFDIPNAMYQGSLTTEKRTDRSYEVEFRNVSFRYPRTEDYVLRNVSVKFRVGERLAVVGENGSGKTTFIKLLCRLYDPDEGEILLNGINIRKYNYRDYMDLFSVVFQDFQLVAQPLGQNVAGCLEYDRERACAALEDAGFTERLNTLPNGLDTQLYKEFGENGVELSGGEAQKVAIARALYKDAPFIILDEPTAALDPIAEAEIYQQFNQIAGDKTAVYISHRLSSCRFCDEILVFDHGSIVQKGSHDTLVRDEAGQYYALWQAQAQYYVNE